MTTISNICSSSRLSANNKFQRSGSVYINSSKIQVRRGDSLQTIARKINATTTYSGVCASIKKGELILKSKTGSISINDKQKVLFNFGKNIPIQGAELLKKGLYLTESKEVKYLHNSTQLTNQSAQLDMSQLVKSSNLSPRSNIDLAEIDDDSMITPRASKFKYRESKSLLPKYTPALLKYDTLSDVLSDENQSSVNTVTPTKQELIKNIDMCAEHGVEVEG